MREDMEPDKADFYALSPAVPFGTWDSPTAFFRESTIDQSEIPRKVPSNDPAVPQIKIDQQQSALQSQADRQQKAQNEKSHELAKKSEPTKSIPQPIVAVPKLFEEPETQVQKVIEVKFEKSFSSLSIARSPAGTTQVSRSLPLEASLPDLACPKAEKQ